MKLLKKILPHLSLAFSTAALVVAILNEFNPRMGFMNGKPILVLTTCVFVTAAATAIIYIAEHFQAK